LRRPGRPPPCVEDLPGIFVGEIPAPAREPVAASPADLPEPESEGPWTPTTEVDGQTALFADQVRDWIGALTGGNALACLAGLLAHGRDGKDAWLRLEPLPEPARPRRTHRPGLRVARALSARDLMAASGLTDRDQRPRVTNTVTGVPGDAAANALKRTLHRLREILRREDALVLRDGKLSLDPGCVWVDTWALEQLFGELIPVAPGADDDRGPEALEATAARLVDLYKGPFLDGSDLPCAAPLRKALHRKFLLAIERLGAAFEAMGMSDRSRDCYAHGLDLDPTAERIHRKLTAGATDGKG
jgi:hypothetical protein